MLFKTKQQAWKRDVDLGLHRQNSSHDIGVVGQESRYLL